jgi:hypothetical protein
MQRLIDCVFARPRRDLVDAQRTNFFGGKRLGFGGFSLVLGCAEEGEPVARLLAEGAGVGGGEGGGFVGGVEGEGAVEDLFGEDFVGGGGGECFAEEITGDRGGFCSVSHGVDGEVALVELNSFGDLFAPSLSISIYHVEITPIDNFQASIQVFNNIREE